MFTVRLVGVDDGPDCYVVGIAEDADGEGRCFTFQEPVDLDLISESPTYCVVDETQRLADGGVSAVSISDGVLTLTFSLDAAAALELDDPVATFPLAISKAHVQQLSEGLRRVLSYVDESHRPTFAIEPID